MATRGNTSFQKRQKEMARKERQQRKAERRENRKGVRSVQQNSPPQDPPELSVGNQELQERDTAGAWPPVTRGHSNL
jgi:hypothetical protein